MNNSEADEVEGSEVGVVVPLLEETATVETRSVPIGKVRVKTIVETLEDNTSATLASDDVEVVRVPVDRVVTTAPSVRTENDVTIIPIMEEIVVVQKQLLLKEEIHIHRRSRSETVEIPITLRKQRATVERLTITETDANEE